MIKWAKYNAKKNARLAECHAQETNRLARMLDTIEHSNY